MTTDWQAPSNQLVDQLGNCSLSGETRGSFARNCKLIALAISRSYGRLVAIVADGPEEADACPEGAKLRRAGGESGNRCPGG